MNEKSKAAMKKLTELWRDIDCKQSMLELLIKHREDYRASLFKAHKEVLDLEKKLCEMKFEVVQLEALFEIKE